MMSHPFSKWDKVYLKFILAERDLKRSSQRECGFQMDLLMKQVCLKSIYPLYGILIAFIAKSTLVLHEVT